MPPRPSRAAKKRFVSVPMLTWLFWPSCSFSTLVSCPTFSYNCRTAPWNHRRRLSFKVRIYFCVRRSFGSVACLNRGWSCDSTLFRNGLGRVDEHRLGSSPQQRYYCYISIRNSLLKVSINYWLPYSTGLKPMMDFTYSKRLCCGAHQPQLWKALNCSDDYCSGNAKPRYLHARHPLSKYVLGSDFPSLQHFLGFVFAEGLTAEIVFSSQNHQGHYSSKPYCFLYHDQSLVNCLSDW